MAEIPVKRSSGTPWWLLVLLALIVVAVVWWFIAAMGDEPEVAEVAPGTMPVTATEQVAAAGPVTELSMLTGPGLASLTGREVRLSNVPVQSVVGDRTFFIGSSEQDRVLVVLDEVMTPGQPQTEGRYDVTEGQTIALVGSVQPTGQIPGTIEGLPANTAAVVRAQSLEILERAA